MVGDLILSIFKATDGQYYLSCALWESEDSLLTTQYFGPYDDLKTAKIDVDNCPYDAIYSGETTKILDVPDDIESDSIEDIIPKHRFAYPSSREVYRRSRLVKR